MVGHPGFKALLDFAGDYTTGVELCLIYSGKTVNTLSILPERNPPPSPKDALCTIKTAGARHYLTVLLRLFAIAVFSNLFIKESKFVFG